MVALLVAAAELTGSVGFPSDYYTYDEIARALSEAGQPTRISVSVSERAALLSLRSRSPIEMTEVLCGALDLQAYLEPGGRVVLEPAPEARRRERDALNQTLRALDVRLRQRLQRFERLAPLAHAEGQARLDAIGRFLPSRKPEILASWNEVSDRMLLSEPYCRRAVKILNRRVQPLTAVDLRRGYAVWPSYEATPSELVDLLPVKHDDTGGLAIPTIDLAVSRSGIEVSPSLTIETAEGGRSRSRPFFDISVRSLDLRRLGVEDARLPYLEEPVLLVRPTSWIEAGWKATERFLTGSLGQRTAPVTDCRDLSEIVRAVAKDAQMDAAMELSPNLEPFFPARKAGKLSDLVKAGDGWTLEVVDRVLTVKNAFAYLDHTREMPIASAIRLSRRLQPRGPAANASLRVAHDFLVEFTDLREFFAPVWRNPPMARFIPPRDRSGVPVPYHGQVLEQVSRDAGCLYLWDRLPFSRKKEFLGRSEAGIGYVEIEEFDSVIRGRFLQMEAETFGPGVVPTPRYPADATALRFLWSHDRRDPGRFRIEVSLVTGPKRDMICSSAPFAYRL